MGIIRIRKAHGKRTARNNSHPKKNITSPATTRRREIRDKNNSAPITPSTRTLSPIKRITRPQNEGAEETFANFDRFCQSTKREKMGTKNPWEKFGSPHHCLTK
jgi:hypothetical protein